MSEAAQALEPQAAVLIVAPHPDDEVLGCGGTAIIKKRSGAAVSVAVMTDGSASHAGLIDPGELVRIRRAEAVEAAKRLGLSPDDYEFLRFPDGKLREYRAAAVAAISEVLRRRDPSEIYIPHRLDRLDDHVATNDIVRAALREHPRAVSVFEYPVWLWNTWPWTAGRKESSCRRSLSSFLRDNRCLTFSCRTYVDVRAVLERKSAALRAYASQTERRGDNPSWPVLADVSNGEFLACFSAPVERFERWTHMPGATRRGGERG